MRWLWHRIVQHFAPPPPPLHPPALARPEKPVVPLARVFPPLPARDLWLAREGERGYSEIEITNALELLRGGAAKGRPRMTRPARFQVALRQLQGFASDCLMIQASSQITLGDMYAGYLLWAADNQQPPVEGSDFDFAMADYLISVGGIRSERSYQGCRFRQDFVRRLEEIDKKEVRRRLGMGLDELMAGKRPDGTA